MGISCAWAALALALVATPVPAQNSAAPSALAKLIPSLMERAGVPGLETGFNAAFVNQPGPK